MARSPQVLKNCWNLDHGKITEFSHKLLKLLLKWKLVEKWMNVGSVTHEQKIIEFWNGHSIGQMHGWIYEFYITFPTGILLNKSSMKTMSSIWPINRLKCLGAYSAAKFFCVIWEGFSLPHDTKFGRGEIVHRKTIFIWSLIHGSGWSGVIKAEPGISTQIVN